MGLGNPGPHHARNRHNVGFMAVDCLYSHYAFSPFVTKEKLSLSRGVINEKEVILCKPLAFMNLSGVTIAPLLRFYKIPLEHLLVIHDDLDLKFGTWKTKKGGGNGGHNGLKNIDQHLGKEYHRLRIGIGHPGHKDYVVGYVLDDFTKEEQTEVDALFSELVKDMSHFL